MKSKLNLSGNSAFPYYSYTVTRFEVARNYKSLTCHTSRKQFYIELTDSSERRKLQSKSGSRLIITNRSLNSAGCHTANFHTLERNFSC